MTEVVESGSKEVAPVSFADFGDTEFGKDDVVIPKILLMQGLSKLVTEGKAKFGDFADSLSGAVLGSIDEPLDFIPFYMSKTWIVSRKEGDRWQFDHIEDCTPLNENKKWEEVVDGVQYKNEKSMNFYVLLADNPTMPYLLQFKSTSLKTGKELATQMYVINKAAGLTPASKVMSLSGSRVTKDGNTFAVYKTGVSRDAENGEVSGCLEWLGTIKSGAAKVDDSDLSASAAPKPQF